MSYLSAYLPQDRLRALARGEPLPDRATGSALFADISGFTPLTEALRETLGPRRGAEELGRHLDAAYTALIAAVERYGGSVIGFAGDAITCWLDDANGPAAARATACAFALQHAMSAFASIALPNGAPTALALKVSVASGAARRFVVGDPAIRLIDALAGATVTRAAAGEHLAQRGEVVVDEATAGALGTAFLIREWRADSEGGERFAVGAAFTPAVQPIEQTPAHGVSSEALKDWLHKPLLDRSSVFVAEFRPCAALFARFGGIDFDADDAQSALDAFVRQMQSTAARYEGALLQLTIGDKGSYAHLNFGVLNAHEDDTRRAVKAALELKNSCDLKLQMGIAQGVMRAGPFGGETRRTFDALGDDVNLAARLMSSAAPGEILASGPAQKATASGFVFEPRAPLPMKGKAEPLPVFAVTGERQQRAIRLQEPTYALPMVGRHAEMQRINDKLELALQGRSQIIGIVADAGMGKSRLVAEVIRAARRKGFAGYGGACQADAVNTPYLAWKPIWSAFFDVAPSAPHRKQIRLLEGEIEERAPERAQSMPLLGGVLDLDIPDNDFTRTLEPKYRRSALRALLEACLRAAAQDEPVLIVIEDLHWIDALSHDLLEDLARALIDSRACFVLAYRPPQLARLVAPRLEALPNFAKIELTELSAAEAEQAIRAKLAQLYPARSGAVPASLVEAFVTRAQGNPFYLEELLNFLRDRGLDPRDPADQNKIDLPDSLHALILSRIDQLSERVKTTLRVASIVGRLFRADWLSGFYPALGDAQAVRSDLAHLAEMEITPVAAPEPDLAYLFKHIVTHEVTYESLPFAARARLHEQLAAYLEGQIDGGILSAAPLLGTLVHHYLRTDNIEKQREYLRRAGRAALGVSAFMTASEYLARLVELTPGDDPARAGLALQLAESHYYLGDFRAPRTAFDQSRAAAATLTAQAAAAAFLGEMMLEVGDYAAGKTLLAEAVPLARASGDPLTLCRALYAQGVLCRRLGRLDDARAAQTESLALARALGDVPRELFALNGLAAAIGQQGDLDEEERLLREVHMRAVAAGNRERTMTALNNLGVVADERQDYATSQKFGQQALAIAREIGAQQSIALYLINLAEGDIRLGQYAAARAGLREGLALAQRLGALPYVVNALIAFAVLAHAEGRTEQALALCGLARRQPAWSSDSQRSMDATLAEWALDPGALKEGLARGEALALDETIQDLLAVRT